MELKLRNSKTLITKRAAFCSETKNFKSRKKLYHIIMNKIGHITIAIVAIIGLSLAFLPVMTAQQSVKIRPNSVASGVASSQAGVYLIGQISSATPVQVTIYNNAKLVYGGLTTYHYIIKHLDEGGPLQVIVTNSQPQEVTVDYHLTVGGFPIILLS